MPPDAAVTAIQLATISYLQQDGFSLDVARRVALATTQGHLSIASLDEHLGRVAYALKGAEFPPPAARTERRGPQVLLTAAAFVALGVLVLALILLLAGVVGR